MNYKNKYQRFGILLAISLLIPFSGKGQGTQQAQKLLDAVAEKVSSYEDIEIDFTWNLVNQKEQVDQKTQGSVMLSGERYRLSMMGMTRVFDGDKLFTIAPEDLEITVSDLDPEQDKSVTPSKLLTFYKEGYTYAWDINQKGHQRGAPFLWRTSHAVSHWEGHGERQQGRDRGDLERGQIGRVIERVERQEGEVLEIQLAKERL